MKNNVLVRRVLGMLVTMSCVYGGTAIPPAEAGTAVTSNTDVSWRFQSGTYDFADGLEYSFSDKKAGGIVLDPVAPGVSSASPSMTINAMGTLKISDVSGAANSQAVGAYVYPRGKNVQESLFGKGDTIYLTGNYTTQSKSPTTVSGLAMDGPGYYDPKKTSYAYAKFDNKNTYISALVNPTAPTYGTFNAVYLDHGSEAIFNGNTYLDIQMNENPTAGGSALLSRVSHAEFNGETTSLSGTSASTKSVSLYGAYLQGNYAGGKLYERTNQATFNGKNVKIDVTTTGNSNAFGIYAQGGYADVTNNVGNFNVSATTTAAGSDLDREVRGIQAWNHETINIQAQNTTISSYSEAAIPWYNNTALYTWADSNINIGGDKAVITSSGANGGAALYAQGYSSSLKLAQGVTGNTGSDITINADDIKITASTTGSGDTIAAYAWSKDAPATIHVNSDATGADQGKTVNVTGDIYAAASKDAAYGGKVFFNFGNAQSQFTGKTWYWPDDGDGSEVNIGLTNNALWNMTKSSYVTNLTQSNGVLNMCADGNANSSIHIANLKGTGGTVIMDTNLQESGDAKDVSTEGKLSDKIYISDSSSGAFNIDVHDHSSKLADDGYLLLVVDSSAKPAATFTGVARIQNGGLFAYPGVITDVDPTDYDNVPQGSKNWYLTLDKTPVTPPIPTPNFKVNRGFADNRYGWIFDEQDTLLKRLGELRDFPENNQGLWVRYKHGDYTADNSYAGDSKYNTFQIGWDKKTKDNENLKQFTGLAYHHTWGRSTYDGIAAKGTSAADVLTVYNSTSYNKGHYLDLVGKVGRMRGDFDLNGDYSESGNTSSWMYSLSAEYGRKKMMGTTGWYIEPQTQLTWTHLGSGDYTSSQGTYGYMDSLNSTIFRVGTTIGRHTGALLPENHESFATKPYKGQTNVYAKVFWNHEFNGDASYRFRDKNDAFFAGSHDYGGSWWTVGAGFTHNLSEQTHLYVDVEKNFGGKMKKN